MRRRAVALGALALALVARPAAATVVVEKSFAALCAEADLIFVGTVTGVESRWSDPERQAIETLVTFGDLTWLRGDARPTATLRFGGGEVDGVREAIAGLPHFAVGDRGVIFARHGRFVSPIVGFHQGAFRVVDGPDGPVVQDAEGHPVLAVPGGALHVGRSAGDAPRAMPLDAFVERVRRQLTAGAERTP